MLQTLCHIPPVDPWLGLPVLGFGWLLLAWGVLSIVVLARLVRRQGWSDETRGYLPVLLVAGAAIAFVLPLLEEKAPGGASLGLPIRGYGVMLLLAVLAGVGLAAFQARRVGWDVEIVYSASFWMFLAGMAGSRTFFVIEYWPQFQRDTVWATVGEILKFTEGGLVVYGSLIGGLAGGLVFVAVRKVPALALGDILAPGMLLGLAIGRIGCFLNGCCFGGVCELPAAPKVRFPASSPVYAHQHQLGQLHGIRIGEDEQGRPIVAHVDRESPAGSSGLRVGDRIESIQLPPWNALNAARDLPQLAGAALEIRTADGRKIDSPIGRPPPLNDPSAGGAAGGCSCARSVWRRNQLGFSLGAGAADSPVVTRVDSGSAVERAGLRVGDRVTSIRLPPLERAETARLIMQFAGPRLTIETQDGRSASWSVGHLPDRSRPVHPTQIYSSINAGLLCLLLWAWYPFRRRDGEVLALLLTLYPISRIILEAIRTDEPGQLGTSLTISQIISLLVLAIAAGLWFFLVRRPRATTVGTPRPDE